MPPPVTGAGRTVLCPAGSWTQVDWYWNNFWLARKRYDAGPGVAVKWRWFSTGIAPYFEGSFTGSAQISVLPATYLWLEFNPATTTTVRITG